uniref:Uncharacterized protein n=1 Tax=Glossina palpalis gambiensis TaxID=67801 RepID=A0A1B0BIQ1_9MUSC
MKTKNSFQFYGLVLRANIGICHMSLRKTYILFRRSGDNSLYLFLTCSAAACLLPCLLACLPACLLKTTKTISLFITENSVSVGVVNGIIYKERCTWLTKQCYAMRLNSNIIDFMINSQINSH